MLEWRVPDTVVTREHQGRAIEIAVGSILRVEVEDVSATGYQWLMEPLDQSLLRDGGSELTLGTGVGGPGVRRFRLIAVRPGSTPIRLKLWRAWEGDSSILERLELTVIVQGS